MLWGCYVCVWFYDFLGVWLLLCESFVAELDCETSSGLIMMCTLHIGFPNLSFVWLLGSSSLTSTFDSSGILLSSEQLLLIMYASLIIAQGIILVSWKARELLICSNLDVILKSVVKSSFLSSLAQFAKKSSTASFCSSGLSDIFWTLS